MRVSEKTAMITEDGRFGYQAAGNPAATPLVFLHGIGGAARGWRNQIDAFSDRYYAVAWDMPGYGGSQPLPITSIPTLAEALKDFLEQIGATKPVLVGHSIGGMIVQQFLVSYPDLAGAAVLAQTSSAFGSSDGEWQKNFIEARLGPLDRGETMQSMAPKLVQDLLGEEPGAAGVELARDCMAAVKPETYRASMKAMIGFDLRKNLADIKVPTLLLSGSKDNNAPAKTMAKMAGLVKGSTYVELEGVGHLANLERPHEFNEVLRDFLSTSHEVSGTSS
ncbi:MAG: alpha/beta hydrolase [Tardiphaga sp.]|jgi:3-oxoadipate enol-lactonase|nr:alpha/beta hydrolase [Tardiphaga sp.]